MESQVWHFLASQYMSQGPRRLKSFTFKAVSVVNTITKQNITFSPLQEPWSIHKGPREWEMRTAESAAFGPGASSQSSLQGPQLGGTWHGLGIGTGERPSYCSSRSLINRISITLGQPLCSGSDDSPKAGWQRGPGAPLPPPRLCRGGQLCELNSVSAVTYNIVSLAENVRTCFFINIHPALDSMTLGNGFSSFLFKHSEHSPCRELIFWCMCSQTYF